MNLMHQARVFGFIVHAHRAAGKDKAGDIGAGDIAGFVEPDVTHEDIPFAEKQCLQKNITSLPFFKQTTCLSCVICGRKNCVCCRVKNPEIFFLNTYEIYGHSPKHEKY